MTQCRGPGGCPHPQPPPQSLKPKTLLRQLYFILPSFCGAQVSGHEQNIVYWSCKRVFMSPPHFIIPRWTETPLLFTSGYYVGVSSYFWCSGLRNQVWGLDPMLLRGILPITEISLWNLNHHLWEQGQTFLHLYPSYQSHHGFLCKFLVIRILLS